MKEFWESRYRKENYAYGLHPNVFYKEQLNKINSAGKILLPMEGEGRNAVYAAKLGWTVDAFDFSAAAKSKALKLAEKEDTSINFTIASVEDFNPKAEHYDAVALIYAHLAPNLRRNFHRKLTESLRPGGTLILEAFTPAQLAYSSGGPKKEDMLYTGKMLRKDFENLDIVLLDETKTELDEGEFHRGLAAVVRLLARKKIA